MLSVVVALSVNTVTKIVMASLSRDRGYAWRLSAGVVAIALAAFVPVTLGTYQGMRDVPGRYLEVGAVFLLSPGETLRHIVLPAAMPAIFTGLREAAANAWQTLIAVELLASTEGLGYLMAYGRQLFQLELVLTAMVAIGLIGFVTDWLLGRAAAYFQRWEIR